MSIFSVTNLVTTPLQLSYKSVTDVTVVSLVTLFAVCYTFFLTLFFGFVTTVSC